MAVGNVGQIDCPSAEVEEIVRDESEAACAARVGRKVVGATSKTAICEVIAQSELRGNSHGVDKLAVTCALLTKAACPCDPMADLREFHDVASARVAELAVGERAETSKRIGREA